MNIALVLCRRACSVRYGVGVSYSRAWLWSADLIVSLALGVTIVNRASSNAFRAPQRPSR
jgi:hypothetical protein